MDLMKAKTLNVVSKASKPTTPRSADVIQRLSGLAVMEIAFQRMVFVTVILNVLINLMR